MTDARSSTSAAPRSAEPGAIPGHTLTPRETRSFSGRRQWLVTCSCGWTGAAVKLQRRALELAEQYHLAPTAAEAAKPSCPHPEKRRFKTREKALAELRLFWRTSDKGKPMPCRAYECRCGYWHTTKQPARNDDRGECL